jgi:hypothetical protein
LDADLNPIDIINGIHYYININNKNVDIKLNPQDALPEQPLVGTLLVKKLES